MGLRCPGFKAADNIFLAAYDKILALIETSEAAF